jgi:hypothetical protein
MERRRGRVLQCGRFGCVVRLEDGRLALLPADAPGVDAIRAALREQAQPEFEFVVADARGRHVRLALTSPNKQTVQTVAASGQPDSSSSLEEKIINFWRQVSEWDRTAGDTEAREQPLKKAERLRPFEERAPRRYRDLPERRRRRR